MQLVDVTRKTPGGRVRCGAVEYRARQVANTIEHDGLVNVERLAEHSNELVEPIAYEFRAEELKKRLTN